MQFTWRISQTVMLFNATELRHRSAQRSSQPMETLLCCPTISGSDTETSNAEKAEDQAKKSYREIIQEERGNSSSYFTSFVFRLLLSSDCLYDIL